ncbi:putative cysteine-rich receptor-like protein kinase 9 [Eucalyptus grandis]|uniref:putative cysteine-rich receptor-like protein kinase 9 n=1 Tax=Eucalyptus grandis TaxID=71139 RepID=UPI00192E8587|nr:putative cysteine-rich receptor-like protein kinase 9 [Eucalyptus grandis]
MQQLRSQGSPRYWPAMPWQKNLHHLGNGWNVTEDPSRFFQLLNETMDDVLRRAPSSGSGKKVAAAEAELVGSQRLYTLAECTPDLTASDCGTCLRSAIARLPPETPGGKVFTPSCNVRFEVYSFYDPDLVTVVTVAAPPPVRLLSPPAQVTAPEGTWFCFLWLFIIISHSVP